MNHVRITGRNMEEFCPFFMFRTVLPSAHCASRSSRWPWQSGAGILQSCYSILRVDNGQHAVQESRP